MQRATLIEQEKQLWQDLMAGVERLAAAEEQATREHDDERATTLRDAARLHLELAATCKTEQERSLAELDATNHALQSKLDADRRAEETNCDQGVERIVREVSLADQQAGQAHKEARWLAHTVYDAQKKRLAEQATRAQQRLAQHQHTIQSLDQAGREWLNYLGQTAPTVTAETAAPPSNSGDEKLTDLIGLELADSAARLNGLKALRLPRLTGVAGMAAMLVALSVLIVPLAIVALGTETWTWLIVSVILIIASGPAMYLWLRTVARRQVAGAHRALAQSLLRAGEFCQQALRQTAADAKRRKRKLRAQRDAEYARADEVRAVVTNANDHRRQIELPQWTREADQMLVLLEQAANAMQQQAMEQHERRLAAAHDRRSAAATIADATRQQRLTTSEARREQARAANLMHWNQAITATHSQLAELSTELIANSPAWSTLSAGLPAMRTFPRAIRFGHLRGRRWQSLSPERAARLANLASDEDVTLPAALNITAGLSLLVKSDAGSHRAAIELLQTVMLRLLTGLPPGKVRFTIIDPVGLGENFASFMHLADYDELLVSHRIWTEPAQIERKLAEITEHMETVIQKYLRNEFATIHDYNEQAGEIAEPLRVIVVANFPAGFTEATARRLASIAANGPRCGVHLLMSAENRPAKSMPIDLNEFARHAQVFTCQGDRLHWRDAEFEQLELTVDSAPPEAYKPLMQAVGEATIATRRVEVPFEAIAPAPEEFWKSDSRFGLDLPLGRAGATRLQRLRLGEGTSQHMLIAGKTGSGKSTLLHALITNAALRYSPQELQLYLIDFKKGVEFKAYVTAQLPHARVVAIESEREFGLSVMQRLDAEMRRRGELFRGLGVQDIAAYRNASHELPRLLFIVDEFQEFFVQDDKVAQDAALLLDRLVRQGRAFGIHVILGSQTLSGAYGLARSTLGQMAVRIALQCNESDAQVILSEDNTAARLLSRPGEAIYNDANGLVEGNHLFQVVWASDERREFYLERIRDLAHASGYMPAPQIVFEGAQPASIEQNLAVSQMLQPGFTANADPRAWLGEPLAIEETTNVSFARRSGANLLWIGQNDRAANGMMTAAMLSVLARGTAVDSYHSPTCTLLHGGTLDAEFAATLKHLSIALPRGVEVHPVGDAAQVIGQFAAELERRRAADGNFPPRFLFLHDLARLRPLRRKDDEFSFGRTGQDAAARPDQQFVELLREGPAFGLHTLVWCDTLANFNRTLDRQSLKEFDARILMQMNAADSSLLTDTALAAQLGPHRAILQREDLGVLEKFRPFSPPSESWLHATCAALNARPVAEKVMTGVA